MYSFCSFVVFSAIIQVAFSACPTLNAFETGVVHGFVATEFMPVAQQFQLNCNGTQPKNLDAGVMYNPTENGQVVIYEGECMMVDLWCGVVKANSLSSPPIDESSLSQVFSVAKPLLSAALMLMYDRGYFQWNQTVAHYWPAFAQNGKANITVQNLFDNSACLPYIGTLNLSDITLSSDFKRVQQLCEIQPPINGCRIGIDFGYSPVVYGWFAEIFSMFVDPQHRPMTHFIYQEIQPITGGEFYFGIPLNANASITSRITDLRPGVFPTTVRPAAIQLNNEFADPNSVPYKAIFNPIELANPFIGETDLRVPAGVLYTNAKSLGQLQRFVTLYGKVGNKTLLSRNTIVVGTQTMFNGTDLSTGDPYSYARDGYIKDYPRFIFAPNNASFGHDGAAGSLLLSDPINRLTFSYVTAVYSSSSDAHQARYNGYSLYDAMYSSYSAQTAPQYCNTVIFPTNTQGYFCNNDRTGFYQCLDGAFNSQSAFQQCPTGTTCGCDTATECSTTGSPCR